MARKSPTPSRSERDLSARIAAAILDFIATVPGSSASADPAPREAARSVANAAAAKAAIAAGSLALPVGPVGWLTILPEIVTVWKIQAHMVADLAAVYGKTASLTREHMLYCLFKHSAAQAVRDLVARVGERLLVRKASLSVLQVVAQNIGMSVTQRALGSGVSRWLPVVGAVGVGAYAYYDTARVASTAIRLFEQDVESE